LNQWLHFAGAFTILSSTTVNCKLYIDGVKVLDANDSGYTGLTIFGSNQIEITYSNFHVNGTIDEEVRIYNCALSASEIQADFRNGPDFSVNLLAKMPKGTTQVITTLSRQGSGSINVTIKSPSQNHTKACCPSTKRLNTQHPMV
jgi:hypothetical protein